MNNYKISKSEIFLGDNKIKNRIVSSPISTNMANDDGSVTNNIISYFGNLASNEIGMVTVGASSVSKEGGDALNGMHIGKKIHENGLINLANEIQDKGQNKGQNTHAINPTKKRF